MPILEQRTQHEIYGEVEEGASECRDEGELPLLLSCEGSDVAKVNKLFTENPTSERIMNVN